MPRHFTPRHYTPRHYTPRHYTPRHYTPRHYTPRRHTETKTGITTGCPWQSNGGVSGTSPRWRKILGTSMISSAMVKCLVHLLDGESFETQVRKGTTGKELFNAVKDKLGLKEEGDYFSISYIEPRSQLRRWLDMEKRIDRQMEGSQAQAHEFSFELKFYPPVPENLSEDIARYFIVLQIRKDLRTGSLPASFYTLAMLGSYTVQSELGDYDRKEHQGIEYLRPFTFVPKSTEELLSRIADLHQSHRGMTPEEADIHFLQNAKRMAMYGMELHEVKDDKGKSVSLSISASGLYLYEGYLRMDKFKWHRMLQISYIREHFVIKVGPAVNKGSKKRLTFQLPTRKEAKQLLKLAVEQHQFFRCIQSTTG
ncbi:band 4.1-like protein 3 [Watersipora subatra]|uniref:band 4.1-like protein 3 n=1 Tax=Watersipora subatra TaxID=2589382 RepID=UPI00355C2F8A